MKWQTSCFALKNISSETTSPNSMKLYRNLPWVTFYKNTRGWDWSTTTTMKWPTSCFALKKHLFWNCQARFTETLQAASLGNLLQKYNKGSQLINNNNNLATYLFCFKKHLLWNYQARFTETLQEASLHDSLAYTPRPLFVGWAMLIMTCMSMKYPLCKYGLNCNIFINALSLSCGPLLRWAF